MLSNSGTLKKGECALNYQETNLKDIKADGGVLACNVALPDGRTQVQVKAFYGGCDVSEIDRGVGSFCEAAVLTEEFRVDAGGGVLTNFKVKGVGIEECSALSAERTCAGLGADLVSAGFEVESQKGSKVGLSVAAGVGGRLSGGYDAETGIFSLTACGKALVGACIDIAVSQGDVLEVFRLGESAYLKERDKIVAVGNQVTKELVKGANAAIDAGGQVVTIVQNAGKAYGAMAEDFGRSVQDVVNKANTGINQAARDLESTGKTIARVAEDGGRAIAAFIRLF